MTLLAPKSLDRIYWHPEGWLCKFQRDYFCKYIQGILVSPEFQEDAIGSLLKKIWTRYDLGGHSIGRSRRSLLLEAAMDAMRHEDRENAKSHIAFLIAMYHNVDYINSHNWFDYKVEHFTDAWLQDLCNLVAAWILLGIDVLPDIQELTDENLCKMTQGTYEHRVPYVNL
jgi:hypothetical protein